jgi:hypothetical protein
LNEEYENGTWIEYSIGIIGFIFVLVAVCFGLLDSINFVVIDGIFED